MKLANALMSKGNFSNHQNSNKVTLEYPPYQKNDNNAKKIAFILKGPYKLAHVEFLHSFLQGGFHFKSKVHLTLILIDAKEVYPKTIDHVDIISLSSIEDPYKKIQSYILYCRQKNFDHICWVACVQNLSLYMGMQLAPVQSYWSMKYHSIIMPTIQKYAGLGFGGKSFTYDSVKWFRGRAFPALEIPKYNKQEISKLKNTQMISDQDIVVGCFVRSEKLHDKTFWDSICNIIRYKQNVHFVIASQSMPTQLKIYLETNLKSYFCKFHHLGWINTKKWISNVDIYYDSFPRGSCNTIFEAIEMNVPVLMADTSLNRESSALPYLLSSAGGSENLTNTLGIYQSESERLMKCYELLSSIKERRSLSTIQKKLLSRLQNQKHLFAKDYLNFFMDEQYKINP
ncbi:thiamine biosynthesis protein ThiC [Synechococcus sp. BL107]|nr:thiamine biosynthesis protein ThiC [Synechococcus sp. BL107]